ncbi:MAG TPA: hypothetical protein ENN09_03525, partial [Planctomycetes bacterium]|nr:hypothetical protein [Planctomycetota bacterium]
MNADALAVIAVLLAFIAISACGETIVAGSAIGVKADDGMDDTKAMQAAIDKVRGRSGVNIVFPRGRYDFFAGENPSSKHYALLFDNINSLRITGIDAELVFHGLVAGFGFSRCSDVTVEGVVMDWQPPSFSVGEVAASDGMSFDVRMWDEFPVRGGEKVEAFMEYDAQTRRPLKRGLDVYYAVENTVLVEPQVLRVNLKRRIPVSPGSLVILRHQVYGYNAMDFNECSNVTVAGATIYTAPGMGITGQYTKDIKVRNLEVRPRPGTNRIMSTTADATHFNCCYGNIVMESCYFEGMGDDAVNVHGMYHVIDRLAGPDSIETRCRNNWLLPPRPGDGMEFVHADTLIPFFEAAVKAVSVDNASRKHRITFDRRLPDGIWAGDAVG